MKISKSIFVISTLLVLLGVARQTSAQGARAVGIAFLNPTATVSANRDMYPNSGVSPCYPSADAAISACFVGLDTADPNYANQTRTNNIWTWVNGVPQSTAITRPTQRTGETAGYFYAGGISGDGQTIVGSLQGTFVSAVAPNRSIGVQRPVFWKQASGLTYFPDPSGTEVGNQFVRVNSDGTYFGVLGEPKRYLPDGTSNPASLSTPRKAYRYSPTSGYQALGVLGAATQMTMSGISGSGDVISGNAYELVSSNFDVNGDPISTGTYRWTASGGLSRLPDLSASPQNGTLAAYSASTGISRDGSMILGYSRGSDGRAQSVVWRNGSIQALGYFPGIALPAPGETFRVGTSSAVASNADGSVIVGNYVDSADGFAYRWDAAYGYQNLDVLARNAGLNLNGLVLTSANAISDNGRFVSGFAYSSVTGASRSYVLELAPLLLLPQTLTFGATPSNVLVGGTPAVSATSASANSGIVIVYASSTPAICTVNASTGAVSALAAGTCTITANQAGNAIYAAAAQVSQSFTIAAAPISTYTFTIARTGNAQGTITSNPSGINCGTTCSASFARGATVTLTAVPSAGSVFVRWVVNGSQNTTTIDHAKTIVSGCTTSPTCTVTADADQSIQADFALAAGPSASTPVPTLSEWGTALLSLLLAGLALRNSRRPR